MNLLCKYGIHKPVKDRFVRVYKQNGRHKWHKNYLVCERCGKLVRRVQFRKDLTR